MTRITRREILCENIVAADRIAAERSAEDAITARALETAPHSYAELKAANAARRLGALLAGLDAATLRLQAVRFLIERGTDWGRGDIDIVAARFARLVAAWQAEQRALAQLELAAAVHSEACATAESREEFAAAQEAHLVKADVYFARRIAREGLEDAALVPTITVDSETRPGVTYQVAIDGSSCTCKGHTHHGHCKHADAQAERYASRPAAFCTPGRAGAIIGDLVRWRGHTRPGHEAA
jgi:hypothetical protein